MKRKKSASTARRRSAEAVRNALKVKGKEEMIKVENIVTPSPEQWEAIIRGMRNPMNSWARSDSYVTYVDDDSANAEAPHCFVVGDDDLTLMEKLAEAGSDHRKYLRMMPVFMDITAPLYWWSEYDTYKVGTVANSCSKMHKLLAKPFEMSDFSFDKLPGYRNEVKQFRPQLDEEMIATEVFVSIDNKYSVSQYGRIKHELKNHYRMISGSLHEDGYIFVTLHGKQYPLHRIVARFFHPEAYDKNLVVNHIDGNKQNNFASNLEWVTQRENIIHSYENGFQPKKVNGYTGKFTEEERQKIKNLWDDGAMSKRKIAERYGVSHTCINDIIGDRYKYAERVNVYEIVAQPLVDTLNELRDSYLRCEDEDERKMIWYTILQLLPSSYNQKRTVLLNYEVLRNMYRARKNHKLMEWREFCKRIEDLPYSELITG